MRVGVVGAAGKMGRAVCRALLDDEELALVAAVDPARAGEPLAPLLARDVGDLRLAADLGALTDSGTEVVVDFTRLEVARATLAFCSSEGLHAVVGTSGFTEDDLNELAGRFAGPQAGTPNCVVAANFAIGAVLMMKFAELAAPFFDGAEIVELHHSDKLDAPSGTALATAARMAAARDAASVGSFAADRTATTTLDGSRGGSGPGGVRLHSVRLPGLVAHQEVVLGALGQGLTVRHDSYDRLSFMDGVLLAVRAVPVTAGLTVGLEPLLGL